MVRNRAIPLRHVPITKCVGETSDALMRQLCRHGAVMVNARSQQLFRKCRILFWARHNFKMRTQKNATMTESHDRLGQFSSSPFGL